MFFKSTTNILHGALLFCSGVMEWAVRDHPEQIGGIGHTKDFRALSFLAINKSLPKLMNVYSSCSCQKFYNVII